MQEITSDVQAGFLIYMPHYSKEVHSIEERREYLLGFVYSALRIRDLMHGILGQGQPEIDFEIYDGESVSRQTLLYDSNSIAYTGKATNDQMFHSSKTLGIGGHTWTIHYNSNEAFNNATRTSQPMLIAEELAPQNTRQDKDKLTELEALRDSGEIFSVELTLTHWSRDNDIKITAALRDITERRKMDKLKSEFISTVSHELRTPLTAIFGSLGILVSGKICSLEKPAQDIIDIAYRSCERLTRLVNDILDIEKIASDKMRFELQLHSVIELVSQAVSEHESVAAQGNIALQIVESHSALVLVDADRFMQLMTNLLSNAIKFSTQNSTVEICIIKCRQGVRIAVSNYGPGIPINFHERIFTPFSQADSSDARKHSGTGLGLSIAKAIVERMSGEIGFTSEPNDLTTFFFTLPARQQTSQSSPQDSDKTNASGF